MFSSDAAGVTAIMHQKHCSQYCRYAHCPCPSAGRSSLALAGGQIPTLLCPLLWGRVASCRNRQRCRRSQEGPCCHDVDLSRMLDAFPHQSRFNREPGVPPPIPSVPSDIHPRCRRRIGAMPRDLPRACSVLYLSTCSLYSDRPGPTTPPPGLVFHVGKIMTTPGLVMICHGR